MRENGTAQKVKDSLVRTIRGAGHVLEAAVQETSQRSQSLLARGAGKVARSPRGAAAGAVNGVEEITTVSVGVVSGALHAAFRIRSEAARATASCAKDVAHKVGEVGRKGGDRRQFRGDGGDEARRRPTCVGLAVLRLVGMRAVDH